MKKKIKYFKDFCNEDINIRKSLASAALGASLTIGSPVINPSGNSIFSQTTQTEPTTLQKARYLIEDLIKKNADDPWSYRFDKIVKVTDTINGPSLQQHLDNIKKLNEEISNTEDEITKTISNLEDKKNEKELLTFKCKECNNLPPGLIGCDYCYGSGVIEDWEDGEVKCSMCNSKGYKVREVCKKCNSNNIETQIDELQKSIKNWEASISGQNLGWDPKRLKGEYEYQLEKDKDKLFQLQNIQKKLDNDIMTLETNLEKLKLKLETQKKSLSDQKLSAREKKSDIEIKINYILKYRIKNSDGGYELDYASISYDPKNKKFYDLVWTDRFMKKFRYLID